MRPMIWIDADPGTDDAHALLMILTVHLKSLIDIIGIATVAGNTSHDNSYNNTLRILEASNHLSKIPVYPGATNFLVHDFMMPKIPYHGYDGFGDLKPKIPLPALNKSENRFAPLELVDIVNKNPGEVILLTMGPLTNIAIAILIDANFTSKLKGFYMMGGNIPGRDNSKSNAEYNFSLDPEAAKIVLDRTQISINVVPFETCLQHGSFSYSEREDMGDPGTDITRFLNKIEQKIIDDALLDEWVACDQLASAWMLDDLKSDSHQMLATEIEQFVATVELNGTHTRGMMIRLNFSSRPNNISVLKALNREVLKQYFRDVFTAVF